MCIRDSHGAFSDYNKSIIEFFDACDNLTPLENNAPAEKLLNIFPNPSNAVFEFKTEEPFDCLIFDLKGQLILRRENVKRIDLSAQASGVYFAFIQSSNKTYIQKLIKK